MSPLLVQRGNGNEEKAKENDAKCSLLTDMCRHEEIAIGLIREDASIEDRSDSKCQMMND